MRLLKAAKDTFDCVVVGLNTDEFCERFKRRPIMRLAERTEVVAACRYVDRVIVNCGAEDSRSAILEAKATHFVHGSDWTGESLLKQLGVTDQWLLDNGMEMVYLPYTTGISSSVIIERIRENIQL